MEITTSGKKPAFHFPPKKRRRSSPLLFREKTIKPLPAQTGQHERTTIKANKIVTGSTRKDMTMTLDAIMNNAEGNTEGALSYCSAFKPDGTRCSARARYGGFCWHHSPRSATTTSLFTHAPDPMVAGRLPPCILCYKQVSVGEVNPCGHGIHEACIPRLGHSHWTPGCQHCRESQILHRTRFAEREVRGILGVAEDTPLQMTTLQTASRNGLEAGSG